ncbi:MAG: SurA N-terminal domain-containing protein, partial [Verrucomicrobia bacterium]|nr:SurA N-terminal domain-containing protein [Verrucomicrobiota bacterium]
MIGTIRKHSAWLWWFIAVATVVSFIFWGLGPSARVGGGMAPGDRGSLYGQKITDEDYENCKREFYIFYWFQSHNWPDKNPSFTAAEMDQQIYLRLMLSRKAKSLGIHVSDDSAAGAAMTMLNRVNDNGQPLSVRTFEQQILEQEYVDGRPLDDSDFERFIRDDLGIEQLMEIMGMAGNFITPGQAADMYRLEHQEFRTHAVFFSASNYLAKVP